VKTSEATPKEFVDDLGRRTIVVVLYQPASIIDESQLLEVRAAVAGSKDVTLLEYTAAEYKRYGDVPEKLGLFRAPSVAVVDRAGTIENFWSSFVDRGLLFHAISKANAARPSKVAAVEAPPVIAGSAFSTAATAAASTPIL